MDEKRWKVGELAEQAGLTVRTLHHWDELGLLSPAERTSAGYRLYAEEEVRRLYRIVALRGLGLSLEEVGAALDDGELRELVRHQIEALDRRMEHDARLRRRLVRVLGSDDSSDLLATVEMMTMSEKYYIPEQQAKLAERGEQLGQEAIERAQRDWAGLIGEVEREYEAGTSPSDPRVQELASRWRALIEQFTGGDAGIHASLERMYREEGVERASRGMVKPELMEYVGRAMAAGS
jgi:MerR family transcriptional regulator, thiopeptide resistance regulator